MNNIADLITQIRVAISGNSYLNSQLSANGALQVTYGIVPQQSGSNQTVYPYCAIFEVADAAIGSFGGTFLDDCLLQFTIWSTSLTITSDIITQIGIAFNDYDLQLPNNQLVEMKRNSSSRNFKVSGQDKNNNFIYQGSIDFLVRVSGC